MYDKFSSKHKKFYLQRYLLALKSKKVFVGIDNTWVLKTLNKSQEGWGQSHLTDNLMHFLLHFCTFLEIYTD